MSEQPDPEMTAEQRAMCRGVIERWVEDLERRAALPQNVDSKSNLFGKTAWMARRELIGGEGKVAILTKAGQSNLEERIQGYQDEFEENWPDVELEH